MSLLFRGFHLALIFSFVIASVAISQEARMYRGYELPPFEIVRSEGDIEVREYQPHLLAEVAVRGDRGTAISRGFRELARYIFGGNAEGEKVAMTVPVTQTPLEAPEGSSGDPVWRVQFMMPASRQREDLPAPQSEAIRFVVSEGERQAVIRFSGRWTDRRIADKEAELRAWLRANGLQATGPARYYFYDGPFTLPMTRRNEVALPVG